MHNNEHTNTRANLFLFLPLLAILGGMPAWALQPGDEFRDCEECPEMVVIPAGKFVMGSPHGEKGRKAKRESPQHDVTISKPFAVGKFEVTLREFGAFVADTNRDTSGGCHWRGSSPEWNKDASYSWRSHLFAQTDRDPVVCASWNEAKAYTEWLSRKTREHYRLLSESEWEYAARAGTTSPYHFGETITTEQANHGFVARRTLPVGSFPANNFGLHDVHGNVFEWVEDCMGARNPSYSGAPSDGSARTGENCRRRVTRGGSWFNGKYTLRSAYRWRWAAKRRYVHIGFRVARELKP